LERDGRPVIGLTEEQAREIRDELTKITLQMESSG
jgi:hypothetical protein